MKAVTLLARPYPRDVTPDAELRRAVTFLDLSTTPTELLRAGYGMGVVGIAVTVLTALLAPSEFRVVATIAMATVALSASYAVTAGPRLVATARRVRALGDAPDLVGRLVLSMRLSPSPERAAAFAGRDETVLGASLARHARRARGTSSCALEAFGDEWAVWFPSLERGCQLVATAGHLSPADREEALNRAMTVVLDGTREQLRSFADRLRGPLTALYAFGVLLPTALVALLPAARAAGVGISTASVVLVYDLLLPAILFVAAAWLLAHRPVTFPPPNVTRSHPDVPDRRAIAVCGAALVAGVAGSLAVWTLPAWAPPIAAIGFGSGTGLLLYWRPVLDVYDRVSDAESGLSDALSLVGRRVADGRSVEASIGEVADALSGEIGAVFERAAHRQRQLSIGVRRAFLGRHGALADTPSSRVRGGVAFLGHAASEGEPAGPAILALADHVDELRRVEAETRHELRAVCGALRSTGALFGPLVAGSTVALAGGMAEGGTALPGGGEPIPWLGFAVGWYALALAVVLSALATGLVDGLDRASVGVHVGRALLSGTAVYLGSFLLVSGVA